MPVSKAKAPKAEKKPIVKKTIKAAVVKKDGIAADVVDVKGKVVGNISLPKAVFGAKVNTQLIAQSVRVYLANQRKGTASTKTRGEVTASTRKIYRQKGTGRARHGGIGAPIFVGGGIAFGPKPRDYSLSMSKRMRKLALAAALTSQLNEKSVKIVDGLEKLEAKTKKMQEALTNITGGEKKHAKLLLVIPEKIESVSLAARNIAGITIRPVNLLNTYEVLHANVVLFMKDAVGKLEETWKQKTS